MFQVFKIDQLFMFIYSSLFIYFNVYLHKFLKKQNEQNMSLTLDARRRQRVRNLVPAKVGVVHAMLYVVTYLCKYAYGVNIISISVTDDENLDYSVHKKPRTLPLTLCLRVKNFFFELELCTLKNCVN